MHRDHATMASRVWGVMTACGEGWGVMMACGEGWGAAIACVEGWGVATACGEGWGVVTACGEGWGVVVALKVEWGVVIACGEGQLYGCCMQSLVMQWYETGLEGTVTKAAKEVGHCAFGLLWIGFDAMPAVDREEALTVARWRALTQ